MAECKELVDIDCRLYRENEKKVHEQLYGNLFLLSQFYPTSKDFKMIFKRDMFVKSNKAAFFQVIHYLLNILNRKMTEERLTAWPPYDIKRENKFRAEVFSYITEINVLYDNADIPQMMASHFISPGGTKFAKFMLKLSQLVIYEHLKPTGNITMVCPKPSKDIKITKTLLNNLKKKTNMIEQETRGMIKSFENIHFQSNEKALEFDNELKLLNEKIRAAKEENVKVQHEFEKNHPNFPALETLEGTIRTLRNQYVGIQELRVLFDECENLLSYLNSNKVVLEHNKEQLNLPSEILHIVKNEDELDLANFFQGLYILLEKKALEFPYPMCSVIATNMDKIEELCTQYSEINNNLTVSATEIQNLLEEMSQQIKKLVEDLENESDEVLAVPLKD